MRAHSRARRCSPPTEEWKSFDVKDLRVDHYIKAGDSYFEAASSYRWKAVGKARPAHGIVVAEFLYEKDLDEFDTTVFSDAEIANFADEEIANSGAKKLRVDHVVKAGDVYFRPNRGVWGFINWTYALPSRNLPVCH